MAPPSLPPGFVELSDIDGDKVQAGKLCNVIGLVQDCRLPIATSGADWKCTLQLFDCSSEGAANGKELTIFRPQAEIPQFGLSDVVVLRSVRVQYRNNYHSLITHRSTIINVYTSSKIPKPPNSAKVALVPGTNKKDVLPPNDEVHHYVSYVFHEADKYNIPNEAEFQQKAAASLNVKATKFSLLKDVSDGRFCDIIARVARQPFDGIDKMTLYVSDYTENPGFFHYTADCAKDLASKATNDPYGYTKPTQDDSSKKNEWVGPWGKRAIQVTCFEPHASFVRSDVNAGDWVQIRNLRVKFGENGQHLEGALDREERGGFSGRVNINVLDTTDRETADPRLIEAVRRLLDYEKEKKQQLKQIRDAAAAGTKRKQSLAVEEEAQKSEKTKAQRKRERRQRKLQGEQQAQHGQTETPEAVEEEEEQAVPEGLNQSIICESHNHVPVSTIASILKPSYRDSEEPGQRLTLPFVCAKYRACVRVVDFHPSYLENFTCSRKQRAYEGFVSDSEDSDSQDGDTSDESMVEDDSKRIWEWRFALQLEDARKPGQRVWVLVDNSNGQCLTGLHASDLHSDRRTLERLRERMFLLWGNLEEKKSEARRPQKNRPVARKQGIPQLDKPQLDSSDREDNGTSGAVELQVSNQPFICCIQQYGVCDTRAASPVGGEPPKQEWTRVFALFQTMIKFSC
ncbi:hypothetical protein B0T16DRAFT_235735 [Cercophora newfieldiana]|uniref:Protection of telomeres protein 1 n=1 Tax=Cercophora newfieldiana TaxID=92897 RepID=A0AA40CHH4_9PEZI|nr:hypothetical protein B0T16DRAFT_235735 [Cercophora newfieldiana]